MASDVAKAWGHAVDRAPTRTSDSAMAAVALEDDAHVPTMSTLAVLRASRVAMKFGYTILYVSDVAESLTFFSSAFGLSRRFLHESGTYGELETGETTLAFASHALGEDNFPGGHIRADHSAQPLGMEIGLVTSDVHTAHTKALTCGATELAVPTIKPWGQVVSYVRAPDGCLIELCTPVHA